MLAADVPHASGVCRAHACGVGAAYERSAALGSRGAAACRSTRPRASPSQQAQRSTCSAWSAPCTACAPRSAPRACTPRWAQGDGGARGAAAAAAAAAAAVPAHLLAWPHWAAPARGSTPRCAPLCSAGARPAGGLQPLPVPPQLDAAAGGASRHAALLPLMRPRPAALRWGGGALPRRQALRLSAELPSPPQPPSRLICLTFKPTLQARAPCAVRPGGAAACLPAACPSAWWLRLPVECLPCAAVSADLPWCPICLFLRPSVFREPRPVLSTPMQRDALLEPLACLPSWPPS